MQDTLGTVYFLGEKCDLVRTKYHNGTMALMLHCEDGIPMARASVNVEGVSEKLPEGHVVVKTYQENEGMDTALEASGLLVHTGQQVEVGRALCPIMRLVAQDSELVEA